MKYEIFVIDDEPEILYLAKTGLETAGFSVDTAGSAGECLEKISEKERAPDLFLIDIFMPEKSGYELIEELRADEKLKKSKFIFFTAAYAPELKQKHREYGADMFMQKDIDYADFVGGIQKCLSERRV
ncbi:MAG: response regulator [Candidatus Goldiibacteriota bacterium]